MADNEQTRETIRLTSYPRHHVQMAADRDGYVQEVVFAEDSRGRQVPVAMAIAPRSWAEAITPDEEGNVVFLLRSPGVEPPAVEEGISARDRVNFPDASTAILETEDVVRLAGLISPPRPRGAGVPAPTDDELASAAEVYLHAQRRNPRKPVVEMERVYHRLGFKDVDLDTLRHHVRMARLNRYLTASSRGRSGAQPDTALLAWRERRRQNPMEKERKS